MRANGSHRASNLAGNHHLRRLVVVVALTMVLIVPSSLAYAGKGGGRSSGGEPAGNNLSVPAVFAGGSAYPNLRIPCGSDAQVPVPPEALDDSSSAYDGMYLQGDSKWAWSAACRQRPLNSTTTVTAAWGDNLNNGLDFRAGRPIRVEMVLKLDTTSDGFIVESYDPDSVADRLKTYATTGAVKPIQETVWGEGARLRISGGGVDYDCKMSAEVNSVGKIVFGFNWGVGRTPSGCAKLPTPSAGVYLLTFVLPTGATTEDESNPTVDVTVVATGGGGGKKGGNH